MEWLVFPAFAGLILVIAGLRVVEQQEMHVVQTFGRFTRVLEPGLNWIFFPFQQVAGKLSLKIESVPADVEIKTKDNLFVSLPVNLMIQVNAERASDAFYKLRNPHEQIRAWVLNAVRSIAASMTLEDLFNDREKLVSEVQGNLSGKLDGFGYRLEGVLVDQPSVSDEVQHAFNRVVAAQREAEAAEKEGEANKIRITKQAEAEAEAQRTRAKGLADSRATIARGLHESLSEFVDIDPKEAMMVLLETNRLDMMRDVGHNKNLIVIDANSAEFRQNLLLPLLQRQTEARAD